jgi:hypothetical protein
MNEAFAIFLVALGIVATPEIQKEKERERLRQEASRSAPIKILSPLVPAGPIRTLRPPLTKMD